MLLIVLLCLSFALVTNNVYVNVNVFKHLLHLGLQNGRRFFGLFQASGGSVRRALRAINARVKEREN